MTSETITPRFGLGVTMFNQYQLIPGRIIEVVSKRPNDPITLIKVQEDLAEPKGSGPSHDEDYKFSPNLTAEVRIFTLRNNGIWCEQGKEKTKRGDIILGVRRKRVTPPLKGTNEPKDVSTAGHSQQSA